MTARAVNVVWKHGSRATLSSVGESEARKWNHMNTDTSSRCWRVISYVLEIILPRMEANQSTQPVPNRSKQEMLGIGLIQTFDKGQYLNI